jgi:anti-sigma factor (TIGR02949 family)
MPETLQETISDECKDVLLHVWDYLDAQLTPDATDALRAHIAVCPPCLQYQEFQEEYMRAMRASRAKKGASWFLKARVLDELFDSGYAP